VQLFLTDFGGGESGNTHDVNSHVVNSHLVNPTMSTSHFVNSHYVNFSPCQFPSKSNGSRQSENWRRGGYRV